MCDSCDNINKVRHDFFGDLPEGSDIAVKGLGITQDEDGALTLTQEITGYIVGEKGVEVREYPAVVIIPPNQMRTIAIALVSAMMEQGEEL